FKQDINDFIDNIIEELPEFISSEEFEKKRNELIEYYEKIILDLSNEINEKCKEKNLVFKYTNDGFAFIPINKNNKEMTEQEYLELSDEDRDEINKNVNELKSAAYDVIRKTRNIKKNNLMRRTGLIIIENKEKIKPIQTK
ncbi:MAG: AAA family ATPase, partial [Leptospiraceae bacterium]|nr:AAA family ATPase [Leptospiraceae bacterium]